MRPSACADVLSQAAASLYSYDDASCRLPGSTLGYDLKFVGDIKNQLLYFGRRAAGQSHLEGGLFCDLRHNTLLVAFRGSVGLEKLSDKGWSQDWGTNVAATIFGQLPIQYEHAYDAADRVKEIWVEGRFNGVCGPKPDLLLTGHSKGGGEAQFAAVGLELKAVVFNSVLVQPNIFVNIPMPNSDPRSSGPLRCSPTLDSHIDEYYRSGNIRDIRMTNDNLLDVLHFFLTCRLAHADMEWLRDTLDCRDASGNSITGHDISTVFRELQACAKSN